LRLICYQENKYGNLILRQDIKSLKAFLPPAGFKKTINQQQMADLLAFFRQN